MPEESTGTPRFVPYRKRPGGRTPRIVTYDFRRPDKFSKEQIRTLSLIHGTFARYAAAELSARAGADVTVTERLVDQITFGEFLDTSKESSTFLIVKFDPIPGAALLRFETPFLSSLVARLSGGPVNDGAEHPELTDLDAEIVRVSSDAILRSLSAAWADVVGLEARFGSFERNRDYAMIVPPGEMIVLAGLEIDIGDVKAGLEIAYPFLTLEPFLSRLSLRSRKQPEAGARTDTPVDTGRIHLEGTLYYDTEPIPLRELQNVLNGKPVKLAYPYEVCGEAGGMPVFTIDSHGILRKGGHGAVPVPDAADSPAEGEVPAAGNPVAETAEPYSGSDLTSPILGTGWDTVHGAGDPSGADAGPGGRSVGNENPRSSARVTGTRTDSAGAAGFEAPSPSGETRGTGRTFETMFAFLHATDAERVYRLIIREHPQIQAMILASASTDAARALLVRFPEEARSELLRRVGGMSAPDAAVCAAVARFIERKLEPFGAGIDFPDVRLKAKAILEGGSDADGGKPGIGGES